MTPAAEVRDPQTYAIIGAMLSTHAELQRGFLECVYKDALEEEFKMRGIPYQRELEVPIHYKGIKLPSRYRTDFICYSAIIVEAKAIKQLTDVDRAQVINYLRATGFERAILANFGSQSLEYERIVNSVRLVKASNQSA